MVRWIAAAAVAVLLLDGQEAVADHGLLDEGLHSESLAWEIANQAYVYLALTFGLFILWGLGRFLGGPIVGRDPERNLGTQRLWHFSKAVVISLALASYGGHCTYENALQARQESMESYPGDPTLSLWQIQGSGVESFVIVFFTMLLGALHRANEASQARRKSNQ